MSNGTVRTSRQSEAADGHAANGDIAGLTALDILQTHLWFGGKKLAGRDALGSDMTSQKRFYPYGEEASATANDADKFATYYRDQQSGLDYADQRYYSATIGRFLSADPYEASGGVANPGSWNRYAYVEGDPINFNDTTGLSRIELTSDGLFCPSIVVLNGFGVEGPTMTYVFGAQPLCPSRTSGPGPRLTLAEQLELDLNVSETCANGLLASGKRGAALERARDSEKTLREAADANGIDWTLLAAIGIMETGFQNIWEKDSRGRDMIGHGAGVFQIDLSKNRKVREEDAFDIAWAAGWAAKRLSSNYAYLKSQFPNFDAAHLLQAAAASWNLGAQGFSGNPDTIDVGSRPRDNYGGTVMKLMDCFR